jgi:peroxiredoxin
MRTLPVIFCAIVIAVCSLQSHAQKPRENETQAAAQKPPQAKTLKSQLQEVADKSAERMPAQVLAVMQEAVDEVRATGIEKEALQLGDPAIDAMLKGWNGEKVRLSNLWSERPIVLMWYRGGWCPYCNVQLRAMQQQIKAIEGAGAKLVVLTPELPERAKQTADANDVSFVALHDKNNKLAKKYGLVFELPESIVPMYRDHLKLAEHNGNAAMELPLAATYVVDTEGIIRYAFLDADYKNRAEPAEVVAAVEKLAPKNFGPPAVGQAAPDFELKALNGESVSLKQSLEEGPVAVVVLRGFPGYQCPVCTRQVGSLINAADAFAIKKARVILVYPGAANQLGEKAAEFLRDTRLPDNFTLVTDPDYSFTNAYGLRWDAPRETAYPSTFVVGEDGKVDFAIVSEGHRGRAQTSDVLDAIE